MNCTAIDWFHEWPEDALVSVSARFLEDTEGIQVGPGPRAGKEGGINSTCLGAGIRVRRARHWPGAWGGTKHLIKISNVSMQHLQKSESVLGCSECQNYEPRQAACGSPAPSYCAGEQPFPSGGGSGPQRAGSSGGAASE